MVRFTGIVLSAIIFIFGNYNFLDIEEAITFYGVKLSSTNPTIGVIAFLIILLIVLFGDEIFNLFKSRKIKIKVKDKF